jgi:hypothetical protein
MESFAQWCPVQDLNCPTKDVIHHQQYSTLFFIGKLFYRKRFFFCSVTF